MKIKKVLVYSGDSDLGLEIINSLKYNKDILLYSAGSNSMEIDYPFHEKHFIIPSIFEKGGLHRLSDIIETYNIDFIYPTNKKISIELLNSSSIISTKIITSPLKTLLIMSSNKDINDPLQDTVNVLNKNSKDLPSKVYTVGCISDRERGLLFCGGLENNEDSDIIPFKTRLVVNEDFNYIAEGILKKIDLFGAWCFQISDDDQGNFTLMNIIPNTIKDMAFNRMLGVNFPLLSLYECDRDEFQILRIDYEIEIFKQEYKILMSFSTVYIDLDDTIIIKNTLNEQMMDFLIQCIKKNKKLILITKHQNDIKETLKRYKISQDFFHEILHLEENDEKSSFILDRESIFVDDSYYERKKVFEICKIPVFDISMIDGLIEKE